MSELKVTGTIKVIGEPKELNNGAKELTYRIDTGEQYNNVVEFKLYKSAEYVSHIDNFIKYNNVGDKVEVEFKLNTYVWKPEAENKVFTTLTSWKVEKIKEDSGQTAQPEEIDAPF